jgi:hypothetical protein
MSRLAARIGRLEERLGPCAVCLEWRPRVELRRGSSADAEAAGEETRTCPAYGRVEEHMIVFLSYEPPPRGNESSEREQAG